MGLNKGSVEKIEQAAKKLFGKEPKKTYPDGVGGYENVTLTTGEWNREQLIAMGELAASIGNSVSVKRSGTNITTLWY